MDPVKQKQKSDLLFQMQCGIRNSIFSNYSRLVLHWLEGKQLADESVKSNDSAVMMIECLEMRG